MNNQSKVIIGGVALLLTGAANAATVCVNPGGTGGCEATIQGAITAASSGDTVLVKPGTYFEEGVTVDKSLILKGSANAVLDGGEIPDPAIVVAPIPLIHGTTDGIIVAANDVTIQGISIRNTGSNGIHINDGFTGLTVRNVRFNSTGSDCIDSSLNTHGLTVIGSQLTSCGSDAIDVVANNVTVKNNKIKHMDNGGVIISGTGAVVEKNVIDITVDGDSVDISGDGATVTKNTIRNSNDSGINITGNSAVASKNVVENVESDAVHVSGNNALVESNRIKGVTSDDAIDVSGENPVIRLNTVAITYDNGINVDCNTNCAGALVSKNKLSNIGSSEDSGIDASADANGMLIEKNRIDLTNEEGIEVSGAGTTTVDKNRITTAAGEEDCIFASGGAHVISSNQLNSCYENGVYAGGTGMTVALNTITGAGDSGVEIDANDVTVEGNRVSNSTGFGVIVQTGITGASITDNLIKNNRDQICDAGTGTVISGNSGNGDVWDVGTTFGTEGVDNCTFL